jgi:hypothetical protein
MQQLFELRGRYFVGVEVLLVLVIPIEFDSAGHRPVLYRNVYTFRIGSHPRCLHVRRGASASDGYVRRCCSRSPSTAHSR